MSLQTHLQRRGGKYRVRVRTPRELVAITGRKEIVCSLHTGDPQVARVRCASISAAIMNLFAVLRDPMLSDQEKRKIVRDFYARQLSLDYTARVDAGVSADGRRALDFYRRTRPELLAELRRHSAVGNSHLIVWAADEAIARLGLKIAPDTIEYRDICLALTRGWIEATERSIERDRGEWGGKPADPLLEQATPQFVLPVPANTDVPAADPNSPRYALVELHQRYLDERIDLKEHTRLENHQYVLWFDQFIGARQVGQLTKRDVIAWKDALLRFPAQASKMFRGKSFPEIVKLNERRQAKTISHKTIAKYLSALRAFCDWCVRNAYMSQNIAAGVSVPVRKRSDARDPYSVEQLNMLFRTPLFTGCRSADPKTCISRGPCWFGTSAIGRR